MNTIRNNLGCIGLALFFLSSCASRDLVQTSIQEINIQPNDFDGKRIQIEGYLNIDRRMYLASIDGYSTCEASRRPPNQKAFYILLERKNTKLVKARDGFEIAYLRIKGDFDFNSDSYEAIIEEVEGGEPGEMRIRPPFFLGPGTLSKIEVLDVNDQKSCPEVK